MSRDNFQGESEPTDTFDFNDRYGVRPERAWVPYALSFAMIGGAWLIWAGLHQAEPAISYSLVAFNNEDPLISVPVKAEFKGVKVNPFVVSKEVNTNLLVDMLAIATLFNRGFALRTAMTSSISTTEVKFNPVIDKKS